MNIGYGEDAIFFTVFGIAAFICFLGIAYTNGRSIEAKDWQKQLIERGLARYHPKTGEWEWIEQEAEGK